MSAPERIPFCLPDIDWASVLCHRQGVMRLRSPEFGGTWMPVFDSAAEQKNKETFWPVAITRQALLCVICREHTPCPAVCCSCLGMDRPALGKGQQRTANASLRLVGECHARLHSCRSCPIELVADDDIKAAQQATADRYHNSHGRYSLKLMACISSCQQ